MPEPTHVRVGPFVTDVQAPVTVVRIFPRDEEQPIHVIEFAHNFGEAGYFQWVARFCVTVDLDARIQKFEVQFLSDAEAKRYTEKAIALKRELRQREEAGKPTIAERWAAFEAGDFANPNERRRAPSGYADGESGEWKDLY